MKRARQNFGFMFTRLCKFISITIVKFFHLIVSLWLTSCFPYFYSLIIKRFPLVSEQRKTKERTETLDTQATCTYANNFQICNNKRIELQSARLSACFTCRILLVSVEKYQYEQQCSARTIPIILFRGFWSLCGFPWLWPNSLPAFFLARLPIHLKVCPSL